MQYSGTTVPAVKISTMGPIVPTAKPKPGDKPHLLVRGMFGIGDCLFERAIIKTLMQKHEVHLDSYYADMFDDLVAKGLHLTIVKDRGRIKDSANRSETMQGVKPLPRRVVEGTIRLTYDKNLIQRHGSILASIFASAGLQMPDKPDFSLPVKDVWRSQARALLKGLNKDGKPLLVYRPIVLNTTWSAPARAPDPKAYNELYQSIRDKFFVVSIADLNQKGGRLEYIVGPKADVDLKFHKGELDFGTMVGLFAEASMIFANPGFVPVMAQAVGTPNIIVYGGNESFRTTNSVGAHLAPTCAIDIDKPCECHQQTHNCDKTITIKPARQKIMAFTEQVLHQPKVLIFGTCYIDTPERRELTRMWVSLHKRINPHCDLLLVDSASPMFPEELKLPSSDVTVYSFPDNVGHLSRNGPKGPTSGGRDGWGRAFSKGLDIGAGKADDAPEGLKRDYDYVVHIEGDSLFKRVVLPIVADMEVTGAQVLTVPVMGTKNQEYGWVETGLMFFDTDYLKKSDFVKNYNWSTRRASPTPEKAIYGMLGELGDDFQLAQHWQALRGDKQQITVDNVSELDWVTHCKDPAIYRKFVDSAGLPPIDQTLHTPEVVASLQERALAPNKVKLNLGCGTNKLDGWINFDKELNITKRLPFADNHADFIMAEHVVEHVPYNQAVLFFKECARVLKPGGIIRITVPSLEKIMNEGTQDYFDFTHKNKWAPTNDRRGAMHAIIYCHGHQTVYTETLLMATLYYCGFAKLYANEPSKSRVTALRGVEGHHRVIGEAFNWIESISIEGTVDK